MELGRPLPRGTKRKKALRHVLILLGIWLATSIALALAAASGLARESAQRDEAGDQWLPLRLNTRLEQLELRTGEDGVEVRIDHRDGERWVDARAFMEMVQRRKAERRQRYWVLLVLNISSWGGVLWVSVGLTGQILFTGRMLVQWLVSEKARQSVVPATFWWMSLTGATMLLIYFSWRRDIVGVLGQSAGWMIYMRNLWMIYRRPVASANASSEPAAKG